MSEEPKKELTTEDKMKMYRNLEAVILEAKARAQKQEALEEAKEDLEKVLEDRKKGKV